MGVKGLWLAGLKREERAENWVTPDLVEGDSFLRVDFEYSFEKVFHFRCAVFGVIPLGFFDGSSEAELGGLFN